MGLTSLTQIPNIMRANGWPRGATLMERWFAGPPTTKPNRSCEDLTTISMKWLLGFDRARKVFEGMVVNKVWSNNAARPALSKLLSPLSWVTGEFDISSMNVLSQYEHHVNFRRVGYPPLFIDDLSAALGSCTFYVCPLVGEIASGGQGKPHRVWVHKVGIHAMDWYDFNEDGNDDLGFWDEQSNRASPFAFKGCEMVTNGSFRNWRRAHHRGGDFRVFSDVKIVTLREADDFYITLASRESPGSGQSRR